MLIFGHIITRANDTMEEEIEMGKIEGSKGRDDTRDGQMESKKQHKWHWKNYIKWQRTEKNGGNSSMVSQLYENNGTTNGIRQAKHALY